MRPEEKFVMRATFSAQHVTARTVVAAACGLVGLLAATPALANGHGHGHGNHFEPPYGLGNYHEGEFFMTLNRGGVVPPELTVMPTRNNCESHLDLKIKWSEKKNHVTVRLTGDDALDQYPDVERTEGVDYLPNPFFAEPEDYYDGRYQLWLISAAGPLVNFYYDPTTLDLLGSDADFDVPPPAIPVPFPTLYMFATPTFQPDHHGDVFLEWSFPYDSAHRGDRPEFSHHVVTFAPPNLCTANPFRLDLSNLRPYISDPLPIEDARPFSDYLRGGMLFDVTIEPAEYYLEPPTTSLAATYSGVTAVGGAIPPGWELDIDAAFAGLAPPIKQWKGAGKCEATFEGFHDKGINFCGP